MPKTTVSHRLDGALLARADAYAATRGSTRSVLIEQGLVLLLDMAEGGVPDLPEPEREKPGPKPKVEGMHEDGSRDTVAMTRQRALNAAMMRARQR